MKNKGISAGIGIAIIVIIAVGGLGAYLMLSGGGGGAGGGGEEGGEGGGGGTGTTTTSATVKLHDAESIDLSTWENNISITGVNVSVTGTVTVNAFSATNITVKLHNKDSGQWVTIVEDKNISDLTVVNELTKEISSGTYDKVSVYIGMIDIDIEWTDIEITGTVDLSQYDGSGTHSIDNITLENGKVNKTYTIEQEFVIPLSAEVSVASRENPSFRRRHWRTIRFVR